MSGKTVKRIRTAASMTLAEFGKKVGVGKITVWRWEHGEQEPRPKHERKLLELAARFGVQMPRRPAA